MPTSCLEGDWDVARTLARSEAACQATSTAGPGRALGTPASGRLRALSRTTGIRNCGRSTLAVALWPGNDGTVIDTVAAPAPASSATLPPPPAPAPLPYGPVMHRVLRPLQRGFLVLNRGFMAPMLRAGLGWMVGNPLTGHVMVLRTLGRRSGLLREAPLGYVIEAGAVWCVAGWGATTPWYRNLLADPEVEVILPTRRFRGVAIPVESPDEWLAAYRSLIASFGLLGRAIVGNVEAMSDAELLAGHRSLPIVRIVPVDGRPPLRRGPFDPGGWGWILPYGATLAGIALAIRLARAACCTARSVRLS